MTHYFGLTNSAIPLFLLFIFLPMRPLQASTLSDGGTVYASLGEDVVLPWTLTLDPGSTIRNLVWQKDPSTPVARLLFSGTTFAPETAYAGRVSAISGSTASIRLANMNETDVGTYRCSVTVSDGGTNVQLEDTQDLEISESVQSVILSFDKSQVNQGDSGTFTCNSTGGNPPPSYIWLNNGTAISTTTSNTLVISSFQKADEGEYSCIASNVAGNVTSSNTISVRLGEQQVINWGIIIGLPVAGIFLLSSGGLLIWWVKKRGQMSLKLQLISGRKVEVQWTAPSKNLRFNVCYMLQGDDSHTEHVVPTSDNHPNYKYIVDFPRDGAYELYVLVEDADGKILKKSDTEEVVIKGNTEDTPITLHDNDTSKTESHVVFMTTDGRSPPLRLEPVVIDKQSPAAKKEKKKKKRKKVNKVNASDEDTRPED